MRRCSAPRRSRAPVGRRRRPLGYLVAAFVLLTAFVVIQTRASPAAAGHPRPQGGSALIALLLSSAGLFTVFLFLPYYLQITLGFPQLLTGVAFLPVPVALVTSAVFIGPSLTRRFTARPIVPLGLVVAGAGAFLLVRLGISAVYFTDLLPSLLLVGAGIGLIVSIATGSATAGVDPADAGAAAASVNAAPQIGGSVGVAVLSTIAGSTSATFLSDHPRQDTASAVRGYATAYAGVGLLFLAGALLTLLIHPKDEKRATPSRLSPVVSRTSRS